MTRTNLKALKSRVQLCIVVIGTVMQVINSIVLWMGDAWCEFGSWKEMEN